MTIIMAHKTIVSLATPGGVAPLDKHIWDTPEVRDSTNCYAFAANDPFGHPGSYGPQPGDRDFHYLREISVAEVAAKAEKDGFIPIHGTVNPKEGHSVVALAVAPNEDYHWYRQLDDGTWWHKPAPGKAVTNRDYSGEVITDPRLANRRNKRFEYKQFGGFFYVPNNGLKVGIPQDRALLREYEIQEVIELMSTQLEERSQKLRAAVRNDNQEFKDRKKQINKNRPRTKIGMAVRQIWHRAEDWLDRQRGRPARQRPDPDGLIEALSTEFAERARSRDRHMRAEEFKKLRILIEQQEQRARAGFRPTEDLVRYKVRNRKGQRHSFVVAADVLSGNLEWTPLTVNRERADTINRPKVTSDGQPIPPNSPAATGVSQNPGARPPSFAPGP